MDDLPLTVAEKETNVAVPATAAKREESNKREINREGEKEERSKKLRKAESKENIPVSVEKKPVSLINCKSCDKFVHKL